MEAITMAAAGCSSSCSLRVLELPCSLSGQRLTRNGFPRRNSKRLHIAAAVSASSDINENRAPSTRREAVFGGLALVSGILAAEKPANARRQRDRTDIPIEDYQTANSGLRYYDLAVGTGAVADAGTKVLVHFDVMYKSIVVVSSRSSKLLGGNRSIAEPYPVTVGAPPGRERKKEFVDNANGLYSAQAAPKPPPALYSVTEGMRVGGRRTVIVPPELGYGDKGLNEIPPGATFEMNVELLEIQA